MKKKVSQNQFSKSKFQPEKFEEKNDNKVESNFFFSFFEIKFNSMLSLFKKKQNNIKANCC